MGSSGCLRAPRSERQMGLWGDESVECGVGGMGAGESGGRTVVRELGSGYEAVSMHKRKLLRLRYSTFSLPVSTAVRSRPHSRPSSPAPRRPQPRAARRSRCARCAAASSCRTGTGNTRTLTVRITYLILEKGVAPATSWPSPSPTRPRARCASGWSRHWAMRSPAASPSRRSMRSARCFCGHARGRMGLSPEFAILAEEDRAARCGRRARS